MTARRLSSTWRPIVLGCVLVVILMAARELPAQGQVRDTAAASPPTTGTSAVSGVVLSAGAAPEPLGRAIVTVASPALPSARSTITDEAGHFLVTGLPAGAYIVTGRKAAFIDGAYGATRPGRPGTPIVIAPGQRADLRLFLARGGVLTGTIGDEAGRPRANVLVSAISTRDTNVEQLFSGARVQTDDRGAYRIFGLAPGDYVVVAFQGFRSAGEIGRHQAARIDELLAELSRREKAGPPAGPTLVGQPPTSSGAGRQLAPLPAADSAALAPAFYPGVPVYRRAEPVRLAAGEVRAGLDFVFAPIRTTTIEGLVQDVSGAPIAGIDLMIESDGPTVPDTIGASIVLTTPPGIQGGFTYSNVPPGRHRIVARARTSLAPPQPAGRGGGSFIRASDPNAPLGAYLYGVADVDVTGTPISGLTLTLRPGVVARGRVAFDGDGVASPVDVTKVRVFLEVDGAKHQPAASVRGAPVSLESMPSPSVTADGRFTVTNMAPGGYTARALLPADAPAGWWLRSVTTGGRDLLDAPLAVASQDLNDLVVTFSNRHSELGGTLQAPGGQPAPDYYVVVFTTDRTLWRTGARRVRVTRPDTRGGFSVRDLPAGEYFIAALTDIAEGEWNDAAFLDVLASASVRVSVNDGVRTQQDIRIAR